MTTETDAVVTVEGRIARGAWESLCFAIVELTGKVPDDDLLLMKRCANELYGAIAKAEARHV